MELDTGAFLGGWTVKQWGELYGELIALHVVLADDSFSTSAASQRAGMVYRANPVVATFSAVGLMVNRLAMLAGAQERRGGRLGTVQVSPTRMLAAAAAGGVSPRVASACLDVVDDMMAGRLIPAQIKRLVASGGERAFLALVFMGIEVGDQLVEISEEFSSHAELLTREGLDAAASWEEPLSR